METTTTLEATETGLLHTEWTDEKHSLYLKGMEATFVNQLYASTDLMGRKEKSRSSRRMHCNTDQVYAVTVLLCVVALHFWVPNLLFGFKVFQGGCWKKVCYGRIDLQLNKEDDRLHFTPLPLQGTSQSLDCRSRSSEDAFSSELVASSNQFHCCFEDLEGGKNEVSDQNFVGEDIEGGKASSICVSDNDQADSSN